MTRIRSECSSCSGPSTASSTSRSSLLSSEPIGDQLELARLKRRKLMLKDQIQLIDRSQRAGHHRLSLLLSRSGDSEAEQCPASSVSGVFSGDEQWQCDDDGRIGLPPPQVRITSRLIDSLYTEAMLLADEARSYFDEAGRDERSTLEPFARVGFACESLEGYDPHHAHRRLAADPAGDRVGRNPGPRRSSARAAARPCPGQRSGDGRRRCLRRRSS